jgi:leader peptidase (prepilin peptidase)/N-methyltransferase
VNAQSLDVLRLLVFSAFALPITAIDVRTRRIPDLLSLGGLCLLAALDAVRGDPQLPSRLAASASAAALFLALRAATKGVGLGDVKLAALVGLFLGPVGTLAAAFVSAWTGLAYAAYALLARGVSLSERIPYAPFLIAGAYAACLARPLVSALH